jgi:hypothetical protein
MGQQERAGGNRNAQDPSRFAPARAWYPSKYPPDSVTPPERVPVTQSAARSGGSRPILLWGTLRVMSVSE